MRRNPIVLIALAVVSALSATVALTHYSAAQPAPSQYRLVQSEVKLLKPSRPARAPRVETKRPDTPSQLANLVVIPFYNNTFDLPEG